MDAYFILFCLIEFNFLRLIIFFFFNGRIWLVSWMLILNGSNDLFFGRALVFVTVPHLRSLQSFVLVFPQGIDVQSVLKSRAPVSFEGRATGALSG